MKGLTKEVRMVKKRFIEDFIKGSSPMLYHIILLVISAALALSLPWTIRFIADKFLIYWSFVGNDKVFFISIEMVLTMLFLFFTICLRKSWKDRKLSKMAKAAGLVSVIPSTGFFAKRRIRKLKEKQGHSRDVMVISSTGFRTFVDPEGELHQLIRDCQKARIMLLNPNSEGAIVRAKSIPDPEITPERFGVQIQKSIDFLKALKAAQKNIKLKLYPDPPFLKMAILGNYIWLQHYQAGLKSQVMPKYVFKHDPDTGSLYLPFYQFFVERWNNPEIPEYDLETDQLIYRNTAGNEVRRENLDQMNNKVVINPVRNSSRCDSKTSGALNPAGFIPKSNPAAEKCGIISNGVKRDSLRQEFFKDGNKVKNGVSSHSHTPVDRTPAGDSPTTLRQNLHSGLHPGGKQFTMLRSRNPICEAANWIALRL